MIILFVLHLLTSKTVYAAMPEEQIKRAGHTPCNGKSVLSDILECREQRLNNEIFFDSVWPGQRFNINENKTVADHLTGLIWSRNANPVGGPVTWQQAFEQIGKLNNRKYLGHDDWRLANVNELETLINIETDTAGWLHGTGFRNIQTDYYWTSTTYVPNTFYAWGISMHSGLLAGRRKSNLAFFWPVRGGQKGESAPVKTGQTSCYDSSGAIVNCEGKGQDGDLQTGAAWPHRRFQNNNDQTVTDLLTGLIWSRNGKTPGPSSCGPGKLKSWPETLSYISCLNTATFLGRNDWRLPSRKELTTLVNRGEENSAKWLESNGFTDAGTYRYWSSNTYTHAAWNAWNISLLDGAVAPVAMKIKADVWPVRGSMPEGR